MPRVRVLTLNFFLRPPLISEPGSNGDWKNERLALFADLHFPRFDVVAFQETFLSLSSRRSRLVDLARRHGLNHVAAGKSQSLWRLKVDAGLVVFSRFPVVDVDEWTFGRGTEIGDWLAAKGVLYACIELPLSLPTDGVDDGVSTEQTQTVRPPPPRHLHLFSTHFQSTNTPRAVELRHRQYLESKRFIDRKLGASASTTSTSPSSTRDAVLFVGDMNVDARLSAEDGVSHGPEYLAMLDIYSGRATDPASCPGEGGGDGSLKHVVDDLCHSALGEHPVTTSRLRVGEGFPPPDQKCIDFLLDFAPAPTTTRPNVDGPSPVRYENVRVEKFLIDGQPFSSLSDHFGVAADMVW